MPRLSCIDAIGPAFGRLTDMLFRPFRFATWLKMGFVGWLAGAASSSVPNFNYTNPNIPAKEGSEVAREVDRFLQTLFSEHLLAIVVLTAVALAVMLGFTYLFCRFRFVLFDSVLSGGPEIARGWNRYSRPAHQYLGFWLILLSISWAVLFLIVGLPLWRAYKGGVLQSDDPLSALFRVLLPIVLAGLAFALISSIVSSLANDFVVPQLALENTTVAEAWTNLLRMLSAEPGAFAGYLLMKFLLSIAAAIAIAIAVVLCLLVLLIPGVIVTLLVVAVVKAMGAVGYVFGIVLAAIGILAGIALVLVMTLLAIAPTAVFFTAYSFQFFGGRYPRLGNLIERERPPAPLSPLTAGTPPPPMPGAV